LGLYQRIALLALQLWVALFALHFIIRSPRRPRDA
jgi:lipopolysaccharide export LptBFGC system permease protein LptF